MTIKRALRKYHKIEIELLLAHVLRKSKEFVFMHSDFILTSYHFDILSSLIKRREKGEPVAYILGYKDFYGLRFKVNKNVLIPRPETEIIVNLVIASVAKQSFQKKKIASSPDKALAPRNDKIKILDIGTGSGCIIISLAKNLMHNGSHCALEFYASDISAAALKVAKQNAKILLAPNSHTPVYGRVRFIHSDLLTDIKGDFDIIIANLPYFPSEALAKEGGWSEWKNNTSAATAGLKFEPKGALFASERGLYQIIRLLRQISALKTQPKLVYLEFDPRQKRQLSSEIKKLLPRAEVTFHKDFAGRWRCVEIIF